MTQIWRDVLAQLTGKSSRLKPAPLNKLDAVKEFEFTARDFERARNLIHQHAGIALAASKQEMVYSRLARRLRATGINTFSDYLDWLERGGDDGEQRSIRECADHQSHLVFS